MEKILRTEVGWYLEPDVCKWLYIIPEHACSLLLLQGQIKTGAPCRSERLSKYNQVRSQIRRLDTVTQEASPSARQSVLGRASFEMVCPADGIHTFGRLSTRALVGSSCFKHKLASSFLEGMDSNSSRQKDCDHEYQFLSPRC